MEIKTENEDATYFKVMLNCNEFKFFSVINNDGQIEKFKFPRRKIENSAAKIPKLNKLH